MKLQFLTASLPRGPIPIFSHFISPPFHVLSETCVSYLSPPGTGRLALADVQSTHSALCSKKVQFLSTVLSGGEIWKDLILVYLDNWSTNVWKYTFIRLHLTSTYLGNCTTFQIGSPDFHLPWQLQYKGMKACFHIALPDFHEFMKVIVPTSTSRLVYQMHEIINIIFLNLYYIIEYLKLQLLFRTWYIIPKISYL